MKKLLLPILFVVVNSTAFAAQQPDQGAGQPQTPASAATARIAEARARIAARFQHESTHAAEAATPEPVAGQRRVRENEDDDQGEGSREERRMIPRRDSTDDESAAPSAETAAAEADAEICTVCRATLTEANAHRLPCALMSHGVAHDHTFHRDCIMPWLAAHDTCPTCRTVVGRVLAGRVILEDDAHIDVIAAVTNGDIALVTRFIAYAIANHLNINPANRYEETPLNIAARHGNETIARLIIESLLRQDPHANINPANRYDETPLNIAAANGYEAIVRLIIESLLRQDPHANINPADRYDETPLNIAARHGNETITRLIIENMLRQDLHANINPATTDGFTPLYIAVCHGHADIAAYIEQKLREQAYAAAEERARQTE